MCRYVYWHTCMKQAREVQLFFIVFCNPPQTHPSHCLHRAKIPHSTKSPLFRQTHLSTLFCWGVKVGSEAPTVDMGSEAPIVIIQFISIIFFDSFITIHFIPFHSFISFYSLIQHLFASCCWCVCVVYARVRVRACRFATCGTVSSFLHGCQDCKRSKKPQPLVRVAMLCALQHH